MIIEITSLNLAAKLRYYDFKYSKKKYNKYYVEIYNYEKLLTELSENYISLVALTYK